eukprot:tig00000949_g5749.t1
MQVDSFVNDAVGLCDESGEILAANPLALAELQLSSDKDEHAARTLWDMIESLSYFSDGRTVNVATGTFMREFAAFKCIAILKERADSARPTFDVRFFEVMTAGEGGPMMYLIFFDKIVDKTDEYTKLQAALQKSEMRRTALLDTNSEAIIVIDETGIIHAFNKAASSMFGYKPTDVVNSKVQVLMPPQFQKNHDQYLRNYLETGKAKVIGVGREVPAVRSDGTMFPAALSVSQPVEINGLRHFVGIVRDRTKTKLAERSLTANTAWVENLCFSSSKGGPQKDIIVDLEGNVHFKDRPSKGSKTNRTEKGA